MKKWISVGQIMAMVKSHLIVGFLSSMLGIFLLLSIVSNPAGNTVFTVIFTLIYFMSIYGTAANCATRDKKPYTEQQPYPWKGLILPAGILIATALLWGLYKVAWSFMTIDGGLVTVTGVACSMMFTIWTFMFNAFMGLQNGGINGYVAIILVAVPIAASGIGYYAGYRGFDIYDKLMRLVYEKKKQ